ncbi:MAG TPA: hypothetical protein DCW29_18320 [Janthinobacterium sp.]|nr:hypothetical protein [Janthinobacterium sp.]
MSSVIPVIDIIIPTTAQSARFTLLQRAIRSIRTATSQPLRIIAVVNGNKHDTALCAWLREQDDILCVFEAFASAPRAVLAGRRRVRAPFFATLDDDDEYLEHAIDLRLDAMAENDEAALIVTNGYMHSSGADSMLYTNLEQVARQPLSSLFEANWLNSGNAIYRSARIGVAEFSDYHNFSHWSWLAFNLSLRGVKIGVLDIPTCRIHDTPSSSSKSARYAQSCIPLYRRMLELAPPPAIRRLLLRRLGAAWHDASTMALEERRLLDAWGKHVRSLGLPGGLRYLAYTRKLLPGWPSGQG